MNKEFFKTAIIMSRSPLGIIGLFIVLIELITSQIVGNNGLSEYQNTILIIFLVTFPFVVLWTFYLLVSKHSNRIYLHNIKPEDYYHYISQDENNQIQNDQENNNPINYQI